MIAILDFGTNTFNLLIAGVFVAQRHGKTRLVRTLADHLVATLTA